MFSAIYFCKHVVDAITQIFLTMCWRSIVWKSVVGHFWLTSALVVGNCMLNIFRTKYVSMFLWPVSLQFYKVRTNFLTQAALWMTTKTCKRKKEWKEKGIWSIQNTAVGFDPLTTDSAHSYFAPHLVLVYSACADACMCVRAPRAEMCEPR